MDKCKKCNNEIDPTEIYGDWFYCKSCKKEYTYQPERSKREGVKFCYKQPDFEKMKLENPCLYEKYKLAEDALRCGALSSMET